MIIYYEIIALLISIVIPTFEEGKETLYKTLAYLTAQTVFHKENNKNVEAEIVISDFDQKMSGISHKAYLEFIKDYPSFSKKVKFVNSDRKGIAYQRHFGIKNSSGDIIVNFDADAYFSKTDAIERLIAPIIDKTQNCVITCCDNILDSTEIHVKNLKYDENIIIVTNVMEILCRIQKYAQIVIFESGMTFTREAYNYVNGFHDVKQYEAMIISPRIIYCFGIFSKQHVDGILVISSARRAVASSKVGMLMAFGDYNNSFR